MVTAIYTAIKDDYLLFDGVVTVTVTPNTDDATWNAANTKTAVKMLREPVPKIPPLSPGSVFGADDYLEVFILFDATLDSLKPEPGYKITDEDGVPYTIATCKSMSSRTRWLCRVEKQR